VVIWMICAPETDTLDAFLPSKTIPWDYRQTIKQRTTIVKKQQVNVIFTRFEGRNVAG
jgi:hypothetical protein